VSTPTPPPFGACAPSPFNLSGFSHGQSVTIDVEGRDALDNASIGSLTVTIDEQGPMIQIGQCAQPNLDESRTDCQITVTGGDVASVQCLIVGVTGFRACPTDASFKTVTIDDLAAGDNAIEVRAIDDLGNIGDPDGFSPITARYATGHIVLEGHDYVDANGDTRRILANAVQLSYVFTHNLRRRAQVLIWCSTSTCDSPEEKNVKDVLTSVGITGAEITEFFDPADLLGKGLVPQHDIVIVHDQNGKHPNIDGIGKIWDVALLQEFVRRGGTLIVLDGTTSDGRTPSLTHMLLVGMGVIARTDPTVLSDQIIKYGDADLPLQNGVANGYTAPKNTVGYNGQTSGWLRPFTPDPVKIQPVVVFHLVANNR